MLVETPFGKIRGFTYTSDSGDSTDVFLGVRYAQPPIGKLRFEKPVMVEPWGDVLDATEFGPVCYPHHKSMMKPGASEDCLSVNFIVPSKKNDDKLPVFVFIHGGGYILGDARSHGYKFLADNYAKKGMIVVTIQYRVGFLGFFSNGEDSMPGNLGLWDQTMALKFIRKVLPSFGGDINRITLGGHSAGSACVTQLLASPHSNTLFSQAIQLSGSGLADWAYSDRVVTDSLKLAAQLGSTGKDLKKCLQEKTMEEFMEAMTSIGSHRKHMSIFQFHPRFDGDFFPEDIEALLKKAPKKKTLQGVTSQENYIMVAVAPFDFNWLYLNEEKRKTFGEKAMKDLLKITFNKEEFGEQMEALNSWTMMAYDDLVESHDSTSYLLRYIDLCSDMMFNIPIYQEIELKTKNGWETYYYVNDYISNAMPDTTGLQTGATHGDEIRYLLEMSNSFPLTEEDKRFRNVYLAPIVNFIKTGSPSTEKLNWAPTSIENPGRHLKMNPSPEMTEDVFRGAAAKRWLERLPQRFGVDTARKVFPGLPRHSVAL